MTKKQWAYYEEEWDKDEDSIYTEAYRRFYNEQFLVKQKDCIDGIWDLMKVLYLLKRFG